MTYRISQRFFSTPTRSLSYLQIIAWWEVRRIPYNLLLGLIMLGGVVGISVGMEVFGMDKFGNGENALDLMRFNPAFLIAALVIANVGHTMGWVLECWQQRMIPGPHHFIGRRAFKRWVGLSILGTVVYFLLLALAIAYSPPGGQ